MAEKQRKLVRIMEGSILGGVANGIAEYFNVDVALIRVIFVLMSLGGGSGVLLYLVMWIILPKKHGEKNEGVKTVAEEIKLKAEELRSNRSGDGKAFLGTILVIAGIISLWNQFMPETIRWDWLWPMMLVIFGVMLIFR